MAAATNPTAEHRRYRAHVWTVRAVAAASVIGIIVTAAIDLRSDFWAEHPMLAGYVSGLLLIALGSALLNEILAARARRRWQAVAALSLIQMRDTMRDIDDGLRDLAAVAEPGQGGAPGSLRTSLRALLADPRRRAALADQVRRDLARADPIAVTWSPVVINDGTYVYLLNTYVTLSNRLWRVLWALTSDNGQHGPGPGDEAIVDELTDLLADLAAFTDEVTGIVRVLLPWPAKFGPAP